MSDSETKKILEEIAKKYDCKIWIAKKIGKRISYISGLKAGKEKFLPPEVVYEDEKIVIFSEDLPEKAKGTVAKKILQSLKKELTKNEGFEST
ncbi:MAG TPA: hypothetical protein EYH25_01650 [Thermotoga sp.]|nr:hypothetical protein [Thermotoga sp.]